MASNNEELPNPSAQSGGQSVPLDPKVLQEAFSKALAGFLPPESSSKSVGTDARTEFYQQYKKVSDEFDKDFFDKYDEDTNTTLIFAGLFSAVASAFLIDAQKNLQPDYAQVSAALLQIIIYKMNNSTFSSTDFPMPTWDGPTPTMVKVQCLLYASLAASLMAALGAMLGRQWIRRYSRVGSHGSLTERSHERQRKIDGMKRWHFDWVMESLPLILQGALLLLGLALSLYLSTIFTTVGAVMISFTSLGVAFYVTIIICGTLWYDCPFQTPASTFIHTLFEYAKHSPYICAIYQGLHHVVEKCSSMITRAGSLSKRLESADMEAAAPVAELEANMEIQKDPTPLFTEEKDTNWNRNLADSHCIRWMQETSTDTNVAIATTRFIPEVQWHSASGIVALPSLNKLWNDFDSCYDPARLSDPITETRDKANVTLKAYAHLYTQRRYVDNISEMRFGTLSPYVLHPILKLDDQLRSTIWLYHGILEHGSGIGLRRNEVDWLHNHVLATVSIQHLAWMLRVIIYRLDKDGLLRRDENIHRFIRKVLERDQRLSILTDCFLALGLTIGMPVHINDLMVVDKSGRLDDVVRIFSKHITWRIEHSVDLSETINTLEILTHCQKPPECVSVACYGLCHRILLGSTIEESMRWKMCQLVMQIGFRHSPSFWLQKKDRVGWPATGLNFLEHQLALEHPKESDYETTADVFCALFITYSRHDDLTRSKFLSRMIASLQVDKPARLKPQIIRFISRFSDRIFYGEVEAMSEGEKRIFLSAILSEDDIEDGKDCRRYMLKHAMRSRVWRPYLGLEHLKVLESLVSSIGFGCVTNYIGLYDDPDPSLIPALVDENLLDGAILKTWLQVLWLDLHIDFPHQEITQQAQSAIKELFIRRPELMDDFRTAVNLQTQIWDYARYPDGIQRGRDKLEEVCKDVTSKLHAQSTSLV